LAHLPHVVPLGGGVLLERDGVLFGALGVSGAREDTETGLAEIIAADFSGSRIAP
jgi:glc operon protein GlcG